MCEAEVGDDGPSIGEHHDVRWLDVSVVDALTVGVGECRRDGGYDLEGLVERERASFREDIEEVLPLQILHDEVVLADVEDGNNVGVR